MSLPRAPYRAGQPTDDMLPKLVGSAKSNMIKGNDDRLFLIVGDTGSGKSTLLQHIITWYSPAPNVNNIVLRRQDFAVQQHAVNEQSQQGIKDLFLGLDEASVGRRDAMSSWVKDIINLYMTNRVFGILHLWAWPSAKLIESTFIEERIAGIFFCYTKDHDKPRRYVFFKKADLLKMIEDGLELSNYNLKKYRNKYGTYRGCYIKYTGPLLEAYKEIKIESALKISEEFKNKWQDGTGAKEATETTETDAKRTSDVKMITLADAAAHFDISVDRMRKTVAKARKDNPLINVKYRNGYGWQFNNDDLTLLAGYVPQK